MVSFVVFTEGYLYLLLDDSLTASLTDPFPPLGVKEKSNYGGLLEFDVLMVLSDGSHGESG